MINNDNYLSNLIRSTTYGVDLALDMVEILKMAIKWQENSLTNFQLAQKEPKGTDIYNIYRSAAFRTNERSQGLLNAYQIISCREVLNCKSAIEDEIQWIEDEFGLES